MSGALLVLVHAASTLFMTGLIWFVQIVHYPLSAAVGSEAFVAYQQAHMERTSWVVGPPMLVEAAAAVLMCWRLPRGVPPELAWLGLGLLVLVWISTAVFQVPLHTTLLLGHDDATISKLVRSNWVRTVLWSLRSGVAIWMAWLVWRST